MARNILLAGLCLCLGSGMVWAQESPATTGDAAQAPSAAERPVDKPLPLEYQRAYEAALQSFDHNDYTAALNKLDEADQIHAGMVEVASLRGAIYVRTRQYEKAQQVFADLYQQHPDNSMALFNLGEVCFLQKNYAQALGYFQSFVEKNQEHAALGQYKMFLCQLQLGHQQEIEDMLAKVQASTTDPLYYFMHAAERFQQKDSDGGFSFLVSALHIYPGVVNASYVNSLITLGYIKPEDLQVSNDAQGAAINAPPPAGAAAAHPRASLSGSVPAVQPIQPPPAAPMPESRPPTPSGSGLDTIGQ